MPPELDAALERGVRAALRDAGRGDAMIDVRFSPWKTRYWSFLRSGTANVSGADPLRFWAKIPKRDPSETDFGRVLADPVQRAAAIEEARVTRRLDDAFRQEGQAEGTIGAARVLAWIPEWSLLVTEDCGLPPLTPVLRRAKRKLSREMSARAVSAIRRAGMFLRFAHDRLPANRAFSADRMSATIASFDARIAALDASPSRFDPAGRLDRHRNALADLLRAGYDIGVPFVATHRGVDARNVFDDGLRQTWIDPEEGIDDSAYHDLARFTTTLGMIDYGSLRGFSPPVVPRSWVDALLDGYGAPSWIDSRILGAYFVFQTLERFEDARRIVMIQPWGFAARQLADSLYTRRFYATLIGDALTELGFS